MKIIDADRLRAEIERRIHEISHPLKEGYEVQSIGKIDGLSELLEIIDSLQQEQPDFPPINPDDAMKKLDEKIALVKQRGTWDGVDVDKYMDDVRGRVPEKPMELDEEVKRYYSDNFEYISSDQQTLSILTNIARHFTDWQKEQMMKEVVEGVVCYGSKGAYIETDFLGEYNTDVYGNPGDKVRIIVCKNED